MSIVGRTHYERGRPVVILIQWRPCGGQQNVLVRREDEAGCCGRSVGCDASRRDRGQRRERRAPALRREVSEMFGLWVKTVLTRFERGDLPGFRLYGRVGAPVRFRLSDLEAAVAELGSCGAGTRSTPAHHVRRRTRHPTGYRSSRQHTRPTDSAEGRGGNLGACSAARIDLRDRRRPPWDPMVRRRQAPQTVRLQERLGSLRLVGRRDRAPTSGGRLDPRRDPARARRAIPRHPRRRRAHECEAPRGPRPSRTRTEEPAQAHLQDGDRGVRRRGRCATSSTPAARLPSGSRSCRRPSGPGSSGRSARC